jgi:hypothetical protein
MNQSISVQAKTKVSKKQSLRKNLPVVEHAGKYDNNGRGFDGNVILSTE